MFASNRQRKVLKFFGLRVSGQLSSGAAGWEVANLFSDEANRQRWRRYVYLTGDFGTDSHELQPFDDAKLQSLELPEGWSVRDGRAEYVDEIVGEELRDGSPFDHPAPEVSMHGSQFLFTGKFSFGTRDKCEQAMVERGGYAPRERKPTRYTDYLVIGAKGSPTWKRGTYGTKIEAAILLRREHGRPAIVSETHWHSFLESGPVPA